ncbi:hypothetical protein SAMN05443667_105166 [Flavobacterium gillisiae]|uniref:Uncharacterized protein n=1 Tax=Flavobacterium gillisiae TaxID=150146 RepID=A0A1H4C0J2_9FLAO|nr:hypothetical protein SAMN05443667_105166 [Flavobacterium gillisiae]
MKKAFIFATVKKQQKLCSQYNYIIIISIIALKRCVNDMVVSHHILKPV